MPPAKVLDFGVVDTHCHLWHWELLRKAWKAPTTIARTYEAKDLEAACAPAGVRQCVLIEAGSTAEDNKALEVFADSSPLITGVVPYIDLRDPKLESQLDYWQKRPKFCGVRMGFEGKPDPELMTCRASMDGFRKLVARGIPFEFLVTTKDLPNILKVYEVVPELVSVIEHLGKPNLLQDTDWKEWSRRMKDLAGHTKVICKLSLGPAAKISNKYPPTRIEDGSRTKSGPTFNTCWKLLAPHRLLWGSDWPLLLLKGEYYRCYEAMRTALGPLDHDSEVKIYKTTAVNTYRLPDQSPAIQR